MVYCSFSASLFLWNGSGTIDCRENIIGKLSQTINELSPKNEQYSKFNSKNREKVTKGLNSNSENTANEEQLDLKFPLPLPI